MIPSFFILLALALLVCWGFGYLGNLGTQKTICAGSMCLSGDTAM
jgi:hypothetical protein